MSAAKHKWKGTTLDKAFADLELECQNVVRGVIAELWREVLQRTPQYTGAMAASWNYSIGSPVAATRSGLSTKLDGVQQAGSYWAIDEANSANYGKDSAFRLGHVVYFTNGQPYAKGIDDGTLKVRPVNMTGGTASAMFAIHSHYGHGISKTLARSLSASKLGLP